MWCVCVCVAVGTLILLQTGSSRTIVLHPCCFGRICLQLMRVFMLCGRLVCASECACAWGLALHDIEAWASGEATAQKSLMMPETDDYLKPSMCNQHTHTHTHPGMNCVWRAESGPASIFITAYPVKGLRMGYNPSQQAQGHAACLSECEHTYRLTHSHSDSHLQAISSLQWMKPACLLVCRRHPKQHPPPLPPPLAGMRTDTWTWRHSENTLVYI